MIFRFFSLTFGRCRISFFGTDVVKKFVCLVFSAGHIFKLELLEITKL